MTFAKNGGRDSLRIASSLPLRLGLPLLLILLGVSCGDTYRPVAQPIPGPSPAPAPAGHIFVVSSNGSAPGNTLLGPGAVNRVDVSGDSVVSSTPSGLAPSHAALDSTGSRLYVANSAEDTVFSTPTASSPQGTVIDLVQLCDTAGCPPITPVFVGSTESNRMYVADVGNGTLSVIDTGSNTVVHTFAVDPTKAGTPNPQPDRTSQPVALVELPNGTKIYSANKGTNSVSSINTLDGTINRIIPLGAAPVWLVANPDNAHVYVLDSAGTISVIDTVADAVVGSVSAGAAGANPNYLVYDKVFNRVYATDANSAQPAVALFDVAGTPANPDSTLVPHAGGRALIAAAPSACSSTPIPTAITVLGDGTRAYVASYQTGNSLICTQATVIDTASGRVTKTIPLSQAPDNPSQTNCDVSRFRVFAASSNGGESSLFKVYVSQCDAGTVAVIDTAAASIGTTHPADWLSGWVPSPVSSFPSSQVTITAVSAPQISPCTPATVTYTYSLLSGPPLQPGMTVYIGGMNAQANDGGFLVGAASGSTFSVTNSCPAADPTPQNGNGLVVPPQNPVFMVPAP
jgi:YVTN family beta-propeller protein